MDKKHWDHHVIGPVGTNCYIFGNPSNAILMDPGGPETTSIVKNALEQSIEIKHVLVTHGHFDHLAWAVEVLKAVEGAKVYLHIDERPVYEEFHDWMFRYGIPKPELREPDVWLTNSQKLNLGGYEIDVLHTPGHSPGSASFIVEDLQFNNHQAEAAFVGDCLFKGSIGRTDLKYCSPKAMEESLWKLMNKFDHNVHVFPGHGEPTNMNHEMQHNPFLKALQAGIPIF